MTVLIVGAGPTGLMLACDLIPQWRTDEILADRFASLGGRVELDTELTGFTQDVDGVTAQTSCGPIHARYLVGLRWWPQHGPQGHGRAGTTSSWRPWPPTRCPS